MKFRFLKSRLLASGLAFGVICGACSPVVFADTTYVTGTVDHVEHKLPALHQAAEAGDLNEVKRLLASGTAIDGAADGYYLRYTALVFAIMSKQVNVAKYLIDQGANIHILGDTRQSALYLASSWGLPDLVQYLFDHGALSDLEARDAEGCTPLTGAANSKYASLDLVKCLVDHGANVNAPGPGGKTPLWFAIVNDQPEIANYLRAHGATEPIMPCGAGCAGCCFEWCTLL